MLKKDKNFYLKFFLIFVIFFFTLTYGIVNKDTIHKQVEIIMEGGSFFAKAATYEVLNLTQEEIGFDKQTYEIELLIFKQINEIRSEKNLEQLKWDPMLARLAREHSFDMALHNYFNHTNLIGQNPTERAKIVGIKTEITVHGRTYTDIGENIGFMPKGIVKDVGVLLTTEDIASAMVYEWMLSDPHKENVLEEDYLYTGIGVAYDGKGNYYITQNFQ